MAVALGRQPRHRARGDGRQRRRHRLAQLVRGGHRAAAHGLRDGFEAVAVEGLAARQQFVQHHAQRVDVGAGVDVAALQLLGRQVVRRAGHQAVQRRQHRAVRDACDAEVQHLGLVALGDEDVGRLDVAVHDAAAVRIGQRIGNAPHQLCRLRRCRLPASGQRLAQVAPAQAFHRDVDAVGREPGVEDRDDAGVVQPGRCAGLVQEQPVERQPRRCVEIELQRLHRHRARQQRVPGLVHRAEPALAELLLQRITANVRQRGCAGSGRRAVEIGRRVGGQGVGRQRVGRQCVGVGLDLRGGCRQAGARARQRDGGVGGRRELGGRKVGHRIGHRGGRRARRPRALEEVVSHRGAAYGACGARTLQKAWLWPCV